MDQPLTPDDLQALREGIVISTPVQRDRTDRVLTAKTLPCEVELMSLKDPEKTKKNEPNNELSFLQNSRYSNNVQSNKRACFTITLREGRNRQIRRMCEARGLRVLELHRESVMGIGLGGLEGEGWWAYLKEEEEEEVREAVEQWERREGAGVLSVEEEEGEEE